MSTPLTDQPPPTPSSGDLWLTVIADMHERRKVGIERYGVPLQRDNGRDTARDYREELLDAMAYAQALLRPADVAVLRSLLLRVSP